MLSHIEARNILDILINCGAQMTAIKQHFPIYFGNEGLADLHGDIRIAISVMSREFFDAQNQLDRPEPSKDHDRGGVS